MIDALFGSKTRVKLLHLFMNNPGKAFYVREITRLIEEQINSVRRELSNMLEVGIITSDSADNKLYYEVNQRHEHYVALRGMFAGKDAATIQPDRIDTGWHKLLVDLEGARIVILAGVFAPGSSSKVDLLIIGEPSVVKMKKAIKLIEKAEGRELNYSLLSYEDFYYRRSVRDRFIAEILTGKHTVLVDHDNTLGGQEIKE